MFKRIFRRVEEVATKRNKKKSIFDMTDLKVVPLDPPIHSRHFNANCGKIGYMSGHKELNDI